MFGRRYFGARMYAPRYFGDGGEAIPYTPIVSVDVVVTARGAVTSVAARGADTALSAAD